MFPVSSQRRVIHTEGNLRRLRARVLPLERLRAASQTAQEHLTGKRQTPLVCVFVYAGVFEFVRVCVCLFDC